MEPRPPARRYDIDWLRVFATYLLFVFHVAMVFNPAPFYHIRNADLSFALLIVAGFISQWHMPLFFLLAGWSAYASLQARGSGGFVRERVAKLFIPLLTGCVLFGPPIKYIELRSGLDLSHTGLRVAAELQEGFRRVIPSGLPAAAPFDESFVAFLPTFFTQLDRFTWSHLWFVAYLFTFSVLYCPLFSRLLRSRERFSAAGAVWVYAPIIPLAVIQVTLRERWPGIQNLYNDWANFAYYSTFLLAGFMLARYPAFERLLQREWKRALGIGVGAMLVLLVFALGGIASPTAVLASTAVAGWCFVVALLGGAQARHPHASPALRYLTESAFPVYILHQPAIVFIGYGIIQLPLGIGAKYALLLITSVAATLAVYQFIVRPSAVLRLLFGMKPNAPAAARVAGLSPTTALVFLGFVIWSVAAPAVAATPTGLWHAEGGAAQVEVSECGEELCGRVVWLRSPFDENGCDLRDRYNPDPALRDRAVVGLEVLRGLGTDGENVWSGGTIYDPASGNTYRCTLRVEGENRLRLRGYLGIPLIGRTTTWIRVGAERQTCQKGE